jgi:hypothetical protein
MSWMIQTVKIVLPSFCCVASNACGSQGTCSSLITEQLLTGHVLPNSGRPLKRKFA